jgi:hypothetical protein
LVAQSGQIRPETHPTGDHRGIRAGDSRGSVAGPGDGPDRAAGTDGLAATGGSGPQTGKTRQLPQTGAAEVVVDAPPEAVWPCWPT